MEVVFILYKGKTGVEMFLDLKFFVFGFQIGKPNKMNN